MLHQRGAGVCRAGAGDAVGTCVAVHPVLVNAGGLIAAVGAVEQHRLARVGALLQQGQQIVLGAARLGEDECFAVGTQPFQLGKGFAQGHQQGLAFGVVADGGGHALKFAQLGHFFGHTGQGCIGGFTVCAGPFFFGFVQRFVVSVQLGAELFVGFFGSFSAQLVLQTLGHGAQGTANGVAAGGQQFPQHQRYELALPGRQRVECGAAQVVGHHIAQHLFVLRWGERLHHGYALGVRDIGLHLAAQGSHAHALQAGAQFGHRGGVVECAELVAEAGQVTKHAFVHQADQAIQLQQRVLQRRGSEQHFWGVGQCFFQGLADDVAGFVDVAQAVGFVHDHQVPGHTTQVVGLGFGELVGANQYTAGLIEWIAQATLAKLPVAFGLQNVRLQTELVLQLLVPLLAQVGRGDDEDAPLALCPALGYHQTSLDGFAQAHFVGQDDPFGQRAVKGKQGRFDLVGIQVHLGIDQRGGQHIR